MEDSYATLSLSTQPKKSSSSTRVLTNDKDPRWDENLYVLVYKGTKHKVSKQFIYCHAHNNFSPSR